jgi:hypothetical protein
MGRVHLRARRLRPVSAVAVPSDRGRPRILGSAPMRSFLDAKGLWTPGRTIPGVIGSSGSPSLPTTATGAVRALRRSRESRRGPEDGRIAVAVHRHGPAGPPPAPTSRGANDPAVPERCLPCRYLQNETADSTETTRRASTSVHRHAAVIAVPTPVRVRASVRPRPAGGPARCASSRPAPHRREVLQHNPTPGDQTKT